MSYASFTHGSYGDMPSMRQCRLWISTNEQYSIWCWHAKKGRTRTYMGGAGWSRFIQENGPIGRRDLICFSLQKLVRRIIVIYGGGGEDDWCYLLPPSQNVRRLRTSQKSNLTNFDQIFKKNYLYLQYWMDTLRKYILWWIYWYWFGIVNFIFLCIILVKLKKYWLLANS
jgi:hypothetical protein